MLTFFLSKSGLISQTIPDQQQTLIQYEADFIQLLTNSSQIENADTTICEDTTNFFLTPNTFTQNANSFLTANSFSQNMSLELPCSSGDSHGMACSNTFSMPPHPAGNYTYSFQVSFCLLMVAIITHFS